MNKLKLHTPDFTEENIAKLAELFPSAVTEVKDDKGKLKKAIDFDQLRQELLHSIVDGPRERYHLDWPGKREALLAANAPIAKTLRPCREESVDFDTTKNLFIEGDNLDALKLLQETYLNKVKMIYVDPPYNTGNDFIYDDDFSADAETYLKYSNQRDGVGNQLVANTEANGRFHSDWISMMYSRIRLACNLLKEDGAIFISLDDNEVANLRRICDEIFGAENFVATLIWQKVFSPKNTARHFSEDHDYIIVYAKHKDAWSPQLLPRSEEAVARYTNPDKDPRGPWTSSDLTARNYYGDGIYEVTGPAGRKFTSGKGRYWRQNLTKFHELNTDRRIWWGEKGENMPRLKRFLSEVKDGVVPQTLLLHTIVGHTQEAKKELLEYANFNETENVLNSVKPTRLLRHLLKIGTSPQSGDLVMDFFAGSGPFASATLLQNWEDSGNRKFVLVQIPEKLPKEEEAVKTIADLAKSRIQNIVRNIEDLEKKNKKGVVQNTEKRDLKKLDLGYRLLKVDSSNMKEVYYTPDTLSKDDLFAHADNIREDRTPEDLLFQVLLDWGVDLSLPIQQEIIEGKTVFFVDEDALVACFDSGINEDFVKQLATRKPLRAVFRDAGFENDSVKINVEQIFTLMSPSTEVKTI